jgi:ABC-type glycerol-3-phosphate transport system permease component
MQKKPISIPQVQKYFKSSLGFMIMILFALVVTIPLYFMVVSSLQSDSEVLALPLRWLPSTPRWQNFFEAFAAYPFLKYIANSFITSISITSLRIITSVLAGYSLAKYHYKGNKFLFILILSTMMLPFEVIMVPMFLVVKDLGWLNSYQGIIIPLAADAFGIFLMRQFLMGVPDALIEAARIDGANELTTLFTIVVPMTLPPVIALAIFSFREAWDLYIWPMLILTKDDYFLLPMGIARFNAGLYVKYNQIMAVAVIGMIPTVALFFFLQRYFIQGIAVTGLKE